MNRLSIFITLLISLTVISQVFAQPLPPFDNVVLYGNVSLSNGTPANGASYNIVVYDDNNYNVLSNVSGIVGKFVSNMIYESQNTPNSAGDIFNVTVVFLDETGKWSHVITPEERAITIVIMPDMTTSPPPPAMTTTVVQRMDYKFNITWAPVTDNESGLMEYRIHQRQNDNSSTDILIDTVPANYTQPYVAGPGYDDGNLYQYNVTVVDNAGNEGNGTYAPPGGPVPPIPFAPLGTLLTLGSGLAAYAYYRRRVN